MGDLLTRKKRNQVCLPENCQSHYTLKCFPSSIMNNEEQAAETGFSPLPMKTEIATKFK
jgi:hypothetical protein